MYQRSQPRRSPSIESISSTYSSLSDDIELSLDMDSVFVPPAAVEHEPAFTEPPRGYDRSRQGSTVSVRSCGGISVDATKELWKCMLQLQERYGCYNSTRMDLAVSAGEDAVDLMPNPFILDTLNDSVIDLPDEGWELLDRCLENARR